MRLPSHPCNLAIVSYLRYYQLLVVTACLSGVDHTAYSRDSRKKQMKIDSKSFALSKRRWITTSINAGLGAAAFVLAYFIRFECTQIPTQQMASLLAALPFVIGIKTLAVLCFGLTSGMWRYASLSDLYRVLKAVSIGSGAFILVDIFILGGHTPRSVYVLDFILTICFYLGIKILVRTFREVFRPAPSADIGRRTLIVGAGDAGEQALRQLENERGMGYVVVGFLDDDPKKRGLSIHGVPILDSIDHVAQVIEQYMITEVLISISSANKAFVRSIVDNCAGHKINFRLIPVFKDLITGHFDIDRMRALRVEDLLGRDPIKLDSSRVKKDVEGRCVLVTGAGGSIGSELARQIAAFSPRRLVLLDIAESPLFEIDRELKDRYPNIEIYPAIVDIRHADEVDETFKAFRPQHVYHAAAFKHVPLMEAHPRHAVRNNIAGTLNLVMAANLYEANRFVLISTDKAVKPSSIMGATKRICERVVLSNTSPGTCFAAVRFGNVLGSNGSVIPIFQKQIAAGGPVQVTHPEMTRYFMTIPEAVELVLQAGSIAQPGDTFVLDMGEPVRIMDLARRMIELSGMVPGKDMEIEITGLRPGEKLVEELVDYGEDLTATPIEKVNVLHRRASTIAPHLLSRAIKQLTEANSILDEASVRQMLWRLIEVDREISENGKHPAALQGAEEIVKSWARKLAAVAPHPEREATAPLALIKHVLIIEDDPNCSTIIKLMLSDIGLESSVAEGGAQAREILSQSAGTIDAIICDFTLLDTTGDKLMLELNHEGNNQPFIMTSGFVKERDIEMTMLEDLQNFVTLIDKPFSAKPLLAALIQIEKSIRQG